MLNDDEGSGNPQTDPQKPQQHTLARQIPVHQQGMPNAKHSQTNENGSNKENGVGFPVRIFGRFNNWRKDPYRPRPHVAEWLTFFITVVLAVIGFLQWRVYRQQKAIMESSGQQTQQLICAANIQAGASERSAKAAEGFAQSASKINDGIHDAVGKLNVQASQTKSIAETSRDALVQVQRAVMTVTTVDVSRQAGQDGKVASLLLFVRWKNVGGTPTKNLTFRHNYWAGERFPDNFTYHDLPDPNGTNTDTPSFAAPQGVVSALPITIPIGTAQDIVDHKRVLTLWGHADYWDVFRGTPHHVTEYCSVITGFYGNIYSANPAETTIPVAENCKTYNCHDEECKNK